MRIRRLPTVVVALATAVSLVACGGQREPSGTGSDDGGRLTIATGNTTGVYYQLGGALASVISQKMSGYRATASETGASVQNVQGLVGGNYDIAFSLGDTAADAVKGENSFQAKQDVVALTRLYNNYTQVAVRTSAGINSIADLKGKRVSTGSPNSGTEVIARRLLEAAGLDPAKDVTAQRLGLPESVDAMKSGSIDALVWSGGLPTGGITDLTTSLGKGVKLLPIADLLPKMTEKYGSIYCRGGDPGRDLQAAGRRRDDRRTERAAGPQGHEGRAGRTAHQDPVRQHRRPGRGERRRQGHHNWRTPPRPTRCRCTRVPRRRSTR